MKNKDLTPYCRFKSGQDAAAVVRTNVLGSGSCLNLLSVPLTKALSQIWNLSLGTRRQLPTAPPSSTTLSLTFTKLRWNISHLPTGSHVHNQQLICIFFRAVKLIYLINYKTERCSCQQFNLGDFWSPNPACLGVFLIFCVLYEAMSYNFWQIT